MVKVDGATGEVVVCGPVVVVCKVDARVEADWIVVCGVDGVDADVDGCVDVETDVELKVVDGVAEVVCVEVEGGDEAWVADAVDVAIVVKGVVGWKVVVDVCSGVEDAV